MNLSNAIDSYLEPPEESAKVVGQCSKCGEDICELEDVLITDTFMATFCSDECMMDYFGVRRDYIEL